MKKSVALLLALAMVLLLFTACGSSGDDIDEVEDSETVVEAEEEATETGEKLFRLGVEAEFTSMSPLVGGQVGYSTAFANGIYEPLFERDDDGEIVGRLATGYEWQDDNTLVITLRDGVTFHNGNDFTAEDVLFSLQMYYDTPQYTNRLQWCDFENSYAEDDLTVVIKTTSYSATLVGNLTSELMMIIDKDWYESLDGEIDGECNGTGPYMYKVWNRGTDFEIVKNPNYWGGDVGYYDEVDIVFYNDATTALLDYETGNLDAVYVQNSSDIVDLVNGNIADSWCASVPSHTITGICMSDEVGDDFTNPLLRQAICLAIPVEELVAGVADGIVTPQNSVIPSDDQASVDVGYYEYDPEQAAALVEQYKEETGKTDVVLQMVNVSSTLMDSMAEAIQAYLAEVGITVEITSGQPSDVIPRYIAGEVNFCINQSGGGSDPADIFSSMERGGNPAAVLPSDDVLDLLDSAKVLETWEERLDAYTQVQQIVHDEYLFLPLYETSYYYAVREGVTFDFGVGHYPNPVSFAEE